MFGKIYLPIEEAQMYRKFCKL